MSRRETFVVLDEKSERGRRWTRITGGCVFEALGPAEGGYYRLPLSQFDRTTLGAIGAELAIHQGGTQLEVITYFRNLGYVPLKDGTDAAFGASLRMVI